MKRFLKVMKIAAIIISPLLLLAALVLVQKVEPQQIEPDIVPYAFPDSLANYNWDLDSIKTVIGDNKGLPPGYELAAAIAFSAYPELKDVKIDMVLVDKGAPMESNFDLWTMFVPGKKNRLYKILLLEAEVPYDPILMKNLPLDAQVGILAHELGHVVYYHDRNLLKIGKWGLRYINDPQFRATHERTTDLMPIYHGLGSQIYQYAYFVRYDPSCVALYANGKQFMDTFYMTDKELAKAWEEWEAKQ
ncbi:MAG: hypothetical protein R8G66_23240 [Cytophagales bacterium]|nr:hypothetical protein [Cytophagales bacterium]